MAALASAYSTTASVTFSTTAWLLTDQQTGALYVGGVVDKPQVKVASGSTPVRVLGRANDVVVTDTASGLAMDLKFLSQSAADQAALVAILSAGHALLLRATPYPSVLMRVIGQISTDVQSLGGSRALWTTSVSLTQVDS